MMAVELLVDDNAEERVAISVVGSLAEALQLVVDQVPYVPGAQLQTVSAKLSSQVHSLYESTQVTELWSVDLDDWAIWMNNTSGQALTQSRPNMKSMYWDTWILSRFSSMWLV